LFLFLINVNFNVYAGTATLRGSGIELQIRYEPNGIYERIISLNNSKIDALEGAAWMVTSGERNLKHEGEIESVASNLEQVVIKGKTPEFKWELNYKLDSPTRTTKTLYLTPLKDIGIDKIFLFDMSSSITPIIAKTELQDIAAIYYFQDNGFFASLNFPASFIRSHGSITRIFYPPYTTLRAGQLYQCHSLTIGSAKLQKHATYTYDDGMVDAVDSYVQQQFAPRFNRPLVLSTSINNRYTQPQQSSIFYTMKDHPTLNYNTDLLKREIEVIGKLGVEYYQVWPGVFDWSSGEQDPNFICQFVDFAKAKRVKVGGYSGTNLLFCPHYNFCNISLNKPEWQMVRRDGKNSGGFCFGNPEFVKYYEEAVVNEAKKFNFEIHCLDFLNIGLCFAENHGHPAGEYSIYHQIKGLINLMDRINQVSPEMLIWPNSGNWKEFLPKLAWWAPNLYLTDPFIASPWQGLNMTRLLDDSRRQQMVDLHYTYFLPYRFFCNAQYFCCRNSIVPDIRNYQYGALSTWAVCPNICLGEVRPWIDELNPERQKEVFAFYSKWIKFIKQNYNLWTTTYHTGDNPGMGGVEVYSHTKSDSGFIFVVNPQYWNKLVDIPLNEQLGLSGTDLCEIKELYPVERLRLTPNGPFIKLGETLRVEVAAQQVLVLEIVKAPLTITAPRMYGLPGTVEKIKGNYVIKTSMPQGTTELCEIHFPANIKVPNFVAVDANYPKQPPRQFYATDTKLISAKASHLVFQCTFRRELAPTQLRKWYVRDANYSEGINKNYILGWKDSPQYDFPLFEGDQNIKMPLWPNNFKQTSLGPLSNFCGSYIENAFSEQQPTLIHLKSKNSSSVVSQDVDYSNPGQISTSLPEIAKSKKSEWWLSSEFYLPFITYGYGMDPFFDDHAFLVVPVIDISKIMTIRAWINGSPIEIRAYRYPRNKGLNCLYSDLHDSGVRGGSKNTLVIYFSSN